MVEIITAIYEKGVLRPIKPLRLKEKQRVRLQIVLETEERTIEHLLAELESHGVIAPLPEPFDVEPISEEEVRRMAEEAARAPGKTLSELILEERGEW